MKTNKTHSSTAFKIFKRLTSASSIMRITGDWKCGQSGLMIGSLPNLQRLYATSLKLLMSAIAFKQNSFPCSSYILQP
jgi:hypothetical protein